MYYSLRFQLVALDSQTLVFNFILLWLVMMSLELETRFRSNSFFYSCKSSPCSVSKKKKRAKIEVRRKELGGKEWPNAPVPLMTVLSMGGVIQMFTPPDVQAFPAQGRPTCAVKPWYILRPNSLPSSHNVKLKAIFPQLLGVLIVAWLGLQIIQALGSQREKSPLVQGNVCNTR